MLKAPVSGVAGEERGNSVFVPLRVAFREQLMQEELMEEEHVQDAAGGAETVGAILGHSALHSQLGLFWTTQVVLFWPLACGQPVMHFSCS